MADFAKSYARTAALEGGYQARTSDSGNYYQGQLIGTNRGISAPTLAAWLRRTPTVADMKALSAATAEAIYRANYWAPIQGDKIANQSIAELIMDFGIHSGTGTAIRHVQRALASVGHRVTIDGVVGPNTLAAINQAPQEALFDEIKASRAALLNDLAAENANKREWLKGWLERLDDFVFHLPAPALPALAAG